MTRAWAGAVLAVLAGAGCSGPNPDVVTVGGTATQLRLATLSELYTAFTDVRGRSPADFAEMRAFGAALPPSQGGPIEVSEAFLVSPRDGAPLVVRYKAPLRPDPARRSGSAPPGTVVENGPVVAYEQGGVSGRRFVVFGGSNRVEEVDESRFKELVP